MNAPFFSFVSTYNQYEVEFPWKSFLQVAFLLDKLCPEPVGTGLVNGQNNDISRCMDFR